nr:hypothetical protein Iba_chr04cCG12990 [Ipomoea batatas]
MSPLLTAQRIASTAVSPRIANTAATLRLQRTAVAVSLSDSRSVVATKHHTATPVAAVRLQPSSCASTVPRPSPSGLQPSSTFGRNNVEVDQNMMAESPFPDDFVSPPVVLPPRVQADPPLDDSKRGGYHGLANLA